MTDLIQVTKDSARGSFFLIAGNLFSTVIQAIDVFIVARLLGPDSYGVYTLSLVVPILLLQVVDFGINLGLTKFSANLRVKDEKSKIAALIRNGFLFKLFIGLIISSLTFILSDYFAVYAVNRPDTSVFIRLASFTIMLNAISTTSTSVFVGMDKMEYGALVMDVQAVTKATLSILLVILGLGIMGPVIGYMIGALAGGLLGALLLHFKLYRSLDPQRKQ